MGTITLQIPQVGQPNSTEDPKIATDFTTIQTVINGNLSDANLLSPPSAKRCLLLQGSGIIVAASTGGDYYFLQSGGTMIANGGGTSVGVPIWMADSGYDSQPQDFQVANKTSYVRLRGTVAINATAPAVNVQIGLYQLSTLAGAVGATTYTMTSIAYNVTQNTPAASTVYGLTSAQFAMPVTANTAFMLGANISGTVAASSVIAITAQLYGYNA